MEKEEPSRRRGQVSQKTVKQKPHPGARSGPNQRHHPPLRAENCGDGMDLWLPCSEGSADCGYLGPVLQHGQLCEKQVTGSFRSQGSGL